mmetsp:Transcript_15378/g.52165  ORF Transcript_15378/g.52165 Transcript_15378/m.52165 type:complete len:255 (-) Transcript_15378:30-794(-)
MRAWLLWALVATAGAVQLQRRTGGAGRVRPELEGRLLGLLDGLRGRGAGASGDARREVQGVIEELEASRGLPRPVFDERIDGRWKLLYTTNPSSASPIQRGFVSSDAVSVFQDVALFNLSASFLPATPTISNVVSFGPAGRLRVTAKASTAAVPLPSFTPRRGDGRILGLNLLGVSETSPPAGAEDSLIDFQFWDAAFELNGPLPLAVPYPVPFRLLGDDVKGWIHNTYFSQALRVARGNKGSIFILEKQGAIS